MQIVQRNHAIICTVVTVPTFSEVPAWTENSIQQTAWQQITRDIAVDSGVVHAVISITTKQYTSAVHHDRQLKLSIQAPPKNYTASAGILIDYC